MNRFVRNSMKLFLVLATPLALFGGWRVPVVQDVLFGLRVMSIQSFGTPAQYNALVDQTACDTAESAGVLAEYRDQQCYLDALLALRALEERHPEGTDGLIEMIQQARIAAPRC